MNKFFKGACLVWIGATICSFFIRVNSLQKSEPKKIVKQQDTIPMLFREVNLSDTVNCAK
jgi:hypothetical protein